MILPANDGHPVKRVPYATEVNHDKTNSSKEDDDPETVFKEIRDEALALAERLGVPAAAKELGLHESQLYGWRVKARAERDQSETERNQAAEIARLKRKVAEQAEELAIVKKAAAYFAKSLQ